MKEPLICDELFQKYFEQDYLHQIFINKVKHSHTRGIDRTDPYQFAIYSSEQIRIIQKKCLEGTYKFSPYLENLHSKGRNKCPRVIAIPTVRDRIVLIALKNIISNIFSECVPRKLANTYIHDIKKCIIKINPRDYGVLRTDIQNFYGSINRDKLIAKIRSKIRSEQLIKLLTQAIQVPIVPKNYKRKELTNYREEKGIPQGLSISNILSSIYINDIDRYIMEGSQCSYFRYVDDILVISRIDDLDNIKNMIDSKLGEINLSLHNSREKHHQNTANIPFDYLGYSFKIPQITIKQSNIDKFIDSIAAKFSDYLYNKDNKLRIHKYLNESLLKEVFILELNEKITGAISDNRRYGWLFYFNAINDLSLLYKLDKIIIQMFERLSEFNQEAPQNLKKLSKAFYEAKYNTQSDYIHNYNEYKTIQDKICFLKARGKLDPDKQYTEDQINELYEKTKARYLAKLDKDDAMIKYG